MKKKKFNALIIGLGKIGCGYDLNIEFKEDIFESSKKIISHARAISCHPDFNLIAGIDRDKFSCDKFKRVYNKPAFQNLDDFLKLDQSIDMVVIAIIPENQLSVLKEVLNRIQPKIILLEKPLAISINQIQIIQKLQTENPAIYIWVNYVRRYLPQVNELKRKIDSGIFGEFIYGNIIYGKGLLTNGSHFINLAQYWLGKLTFYKKLNKGFEYNHYDSDCSFVLKKENNKSLLSVCSIGGYGFRAEVMDLWFEGGRICLLNGGKELAFWPRIKSKTQDLESFDSISLTPEIFPIDITRCQYHVLDEISKTFKKQTNVKMQSFLQDSFETMELMDLALSSEIL